MTVSAALVLLAVIWFLCLFVILPIGLRTQGDEGNVVAGTHASSPANFNGKRIALKVTLLALPIWILSCAIIHNEWISIETLDIYKGIKPN